MQLAVHFLGLELFCLTLIADETAPEGDGVELAGGTTASTPMGFVPSFGDQRWEPGPGAGDL